MRNNDFFPLRPEVTPTIYAYELLNVQSHQGLLKVGYTDRDPKLRIAEQVKTAGLDFKIKVSKSAMRKDGSTFTDHDIHRQLIKNGIKKIKGEWFRCSVNDVLIAIREVSTRELMEENRHFDFKMRPEQLEAVEKTAAYFKSFKKENKQNTPRFLWNAKMRFGKTFTSYHLALKMGWKKILVVTFKPAAEFAWKEDLNTHVDFKGWKFYSAKSDSIIQADKKIDKYVYFGSFQDLLGKDKDTGGIKVKNKWLHGVQWDCVIFDEYHFGAWRDNAKDLFGRDIDANLEEEQYSKIEKVGIAEEDKPEFLEKNLPIETKHFLYLSGTPFRAINSGEFIEEAVFNWTYTDEQRSKLNWKGTNNPYASLPRMVLMTYQLPESIRNIALKGEFNEFDLNSFFSAEGVDNEAYFVFEDEVQKWLDLIRGAFSETTVDNLKMGAKKPPLPFYHAPLLKILNHTLWFLPNVAACFAMKNLLSQRQNKFYHDFQLVVAAGNKAGMGVDALEPVKNAMTETPLESRTITLTCGKLTTGVSVKPWCGIFMLRNCSSPETYFQAAFRVQTPWTIKNPDGLSPDSIEILKEECYVFDFAPDRALRQVAEYSCRLNLDEIGPEKKVADFISFLPILAYDGSSMTPIDPAGILDMAMNGTTATLLARRWESALLVNVDNETLKRLIANDDALKALMSIEGFRSLRQDIETIINKSDAVSKTKKSAQDKEITDKEKMKLSDDEKEYKSLRKQIQEKLIKFATRIPVFMYLTDFREVALKDVITQLEPGLFKKVTGLTVSDFELLVGLNLFNGPLMNDAIYKFKRYEDSSLEYSGIQKQGKGKIGGFDSVISKDDYDAIYGEKPESF